MGKYLNPKAEPVFKRIFGKHPELVMSLLNALLPAEDDYLLDMSGIQLISRSAADELYNLTHGSKRVEIINLEPFVEKMFSAVTLGRFLPRHHTSTDLPILECQTIEQVAQQLTSSVVL